MAPADGKNDGKMSRRETHAGQTKPDPEDAFPPEESAGTDPQLAGLPDLAKRVLALGLSGMFATQESVRQAVGDALPKEWVDFAAGQSERTRAEFLERLAGELARTLESIDLARVMQRALEGRTLEVTAKIRMLPDEPGKTGTRLSLTMEDDPSE